MDVGGTDPCINNRIQKAMHSSYLSGVVQVAIERQKRKEKKKHLG